MIILGLDYSACLLENLLDGIAAAARTAAMTRSERMAELSLAAYLHGDAEAERLLCQFDAEDEAEAEREQADHEARMESDEAYYFEHCHPLERLSIEAAR